jgi:hypothetical protein
VTITINQPKPGYCKGCTVERLHGNYAMSLCGKCLATVPAAKREQLLRALNAQAKQEAPKEQWVPT